MKTVLSLLALAILSTNAFAADAASCKAKLNGVADEYALWKSQQTDATCLAEIDKPGATRSALVIGAKCKGALVAIGIQGPSATTIKQHSSAACGECKGVNAQLGAACGDNGISAFINAVKAL